MPPRGDDMKVYDVALPPHQVEAEWQELVQRFREWLKRRGSSSFTQ